MPLSFGAMLRRRCSILAAFLIAIAACSTAGSKPPATPTSPTLAEWRDRMSEVDTHRKLMKGMLLDGEATDLRAVADAATAAAEHLRLGYGRLEQRSVPEFAKMARDAESWLLQVALEARQAHGDIARDLFAAGKPHCVRCHDAYEKVHG